MIKNKLFLFILFFIFGCQGGKENKKFDGVCKKITIEKRTSGKCLAKQRQFCKAIFCGKTNILDYDSIEITECHCQ